MLCCAVSDKFIFKLNLFIDIALLVAVSAFAYKHPDFTVFVSARYENHLKRIFFTLLVTLAFMTILNILIYFKKNKVYFANNVIFLTTKIGLCLFTAACFAADITYRNDPNRLLSNTQYMYSFITVLLLLHLNTLGLKSCDSGPAPVNMPLSELTISIDKLPENE